MDLESNQLTHEKAFFGGVNDILRSLETNHSLISLNLANNQMERGCGEIMNEVLDKNFTLIDFDYSMNEFSLEDSREIQEKLKRNKRKYDEERLQEWRERKMMRAEDEALKLLFMQQNSKNEQNRMEEEAKEIKEAELNEKWKKFMTESEIEKQQIIQQLMEAALLRNSKGRRGKGKGKGKGKKKK